MSGRLVLMAHDLTATKPPDDDGVSLGWYVAVLRERWKIIVIGAVVGMLLASAFLVVTEKSYTARTVVSMNVIGSSPIRPVDAASRLIDTTTEIQLASSYEVASLASKELGDRLSAREIRDAVAVSSVADATVLVVSFTAVTPDGARQGATAVAQGYLDYRSALAVKRIAEDVASIEARVVQQQSELDDMAADLEQENPDSEGFLRLEADRSVLLESLRTLLGQQFDLERIDTSAGVIISPADENYVEVSPSRSMVLASGLLGGVLLGMAAAFLVNATGRTVTSQRQLAALSGWRSLGEVQVGGDAHSPEHFEGADVRAAAARLTGEVTDVDGSVAVVVDAAGDSIPTVVPFVLAASVAQGRRPVSIIVAGLSEEDQSRVIENLHLWPVRANRSQPMFRMPLSSRVSVFFAPLDGGAGEFDTMIEWARDRRTRGSEDVVPLVWFVVTDTANADARLLAVQRANTAVLVSRLEVTTRQSIEELVEMSEHFGRRTVAPVTAAPRRSDVFRNPLQGGERHMSIAEPINGERAQVASSWR